jgi:Methyltransferase FkbM domain
VPFWKDPVISLRAWPPLNAVTRRASIREQGIAKVDLVKIDTETTEPAVIRGMARTLARDRPDVVCEVLAGLRPVRPSKPLSVRSVIASSC